MRTGSSSSETLGRITEGVEWVESAPASAENSSEGAELQQQLLRQQQQLLLLQQQLPHAGVVPALSPTASSSSSGAPQPMPPGQSTGLQCHGGNQGHSLLQAPLVSPRQHHRALSFQLPSPDAEVPGGEGGGGNAVGFTSTSLQAPAVQLFMQQDIHGCFTGHVPALISPMASSTSSTPALSPLPSQGQAGTGALSSNAELKGEPSAVDSASASDMLITWHGFEDSGSTHGSSTAISYFEAAPESGQAFKEEGLLPDINPRGKKGDGGVVGSRKGGAGGVGEAKGFLEKLKKTLKLGKGGGDSGSGSKSPMHKERGRSRSGSVPKSSTGQSAVSPQGNQGSARDQQAQGQGQQGQWQGQRQASPLAQQGQEQRGEGSLRGIPPPPLGGSARFSSPHLDDLLRASPHASGHVTPEHTQVQQGPAGGTPGVGALSGPLPSMGWSSGSHVPGASSREGGGQQKRGSLSGPLGMAGSPADAKRCSPGGSSTSPGGGSVSPGGTKRDGQTLIGIAPGASPAALEAYLKSKAMRQQKAGKRVVKVVEVAME